MSKKRLRIILSLALLCYCSGVARGAAAPLNQGGFTALLGNLSMGRLEYRLGDSWKAAVFSERGGSNMGLVVQPFSGLNLKAGYTYDNNAVAGVPYGGVNIDLPVGLNRLRVGGGYDYNYAGKDWARYEAFLRIPMYPQVFLDAGLRGDAGVGAPQYSYHNAREALLFLRGGIEWTKNNWELDLKPLLYVKGTLLHDYTVKYHLNDRVGLAVNMNTLSGGSDLSYRAGIQFRF